MQTSLIFFLVLFLAGCGAEKRDSFQGYVEGDFISAAPLFAGRLEQLKVDRGDNITAGDLLFTLDDRNEKIALVQANRRLESAEARLGDALSGRRPQEIGVIKSQLAKAEAQALRSRQQLERDRALYDNNTITKARLDESIAMAGADAAVVRQMRAELEVAHLPAREDAIKALRADAEAAGAAVEQAQWNLEQRFVHAPQGGRVYEVIYRKGELVPAGAPVLRFLPPENIKIRFFVSESAMKRISYGREVIVTAGDRKIKARVTYVSEEAEYTPPVIYSNETKHKLIFMAEAVPAEPGLLLVGQPVSVMLQ